MSAIDVRYYLERWARWREGAKYYGSGVAGGLLGALRNGRGSVLCPTCKGGKRMPGYLVGSPQEFINVPCPDCGGDGKVDGDLVTLDRRREIPCVYCCDPETGTSTGEINGRTCHKCHGGTRLIVELKVHPATIKGTRYLGPDIDPDPASVLVNKTVIGWAERNETYWLNRVVIEEYTRNGTQEMKAVKMGVSRGWYQKNLIQAHRCLAGVLEKFHSVID